MQLIGVPNKDNIKLRMQCSRINNNKTCNAVSYTHLDVYKRQTLSSL